MNTVKNIIRKQTVNFQYNGNTDAFALQKEVSDWCNFSLIPEIQQQLDLFDLGDMYLSIDKLTINALVNKKNWQQQIRNELIANLSQKLRDYKPAVAKRTEIERFETRAQKLDELILFYFEKGYLPWWSKAFVQTDFNALLLSWISEEKTQSRCDEILFRLQQIIAAPVIQRILNQVPGSLFFKMVVSIFKTEANMICEAESFIAAQGKEAGSMTSKKRMVAAFHEILLTMLIKNAGKLDIVQTVQQFHATMQYETNRKVFLVKVFNTESLSKENHFVKAWQNIVAAAQTIKVEKRLKTEKKATKRTVDPNIEKLNKSNPENDDQVQVNEVLHDGIYIENAGAVIVAAFLPRLFDRLKIADKAEIIKPDLAVMIIQYIVSGKAKAEEHELVLPKILCGISPGQHVNTAINITKPQQAEADEMLEALIAHWSILKGTSVQGLRESFLKRSGKLMQVEEEWLLQAEQKAYDMLLQQLPWSISMIKLPWMENVLKTEWV